MTSPWFGSSKRPPLTAVQRWQVGLIVFGVGLLAVGGVVLLMDVKPERYLGILAWFVGALIVHDGIAAMAGFGVSLVMRRAGRRKSYGVGRAHASARARAAGERERAFLF